MKTEKRTEDDMAEDFYCSEITEEIWKRIEGKSYKPECTVPVSICAASMSCTKIWTA